MVQLIFIRIRKLQADNLIFYDLSVNNDAQWYLKLGQAGYPFHPQNANLNDKNTMDALSYAFFPVCFLLFLFILLIGIGLVEYLEIYSSSLFSRVSISYITYILYCLVILLVMSGKESEDRVQLKREQARAAGVKGGKVGRVRKPEVLIQVARGERALTLKRRAFVSKVRILRRG